MVFNYVFNLFAYTCCGRKLRNWFICKLVWNIVGWWTIINLLFLYMRQLFIHKRVWNIVGWWTIINLLFLYLWQLRLKLYLWNNNKIYHRILIDCISACWRVTNSLNIFKVLTNIYLYIYVCNAGYIQRTRST